mgnify:CR=1 FL=1
MKWNRLAPADEQPGGVGKLEVGPVRFIDLHDLDTQFAQRVERRSEGSKHPRLRASEGVSGDSEAETSHVRADELSIVQAGALHFFVGGQEVFAQQVRIPRRAFLGVDDDDEKSILEIAGDYVMQPFGGPDAAAH